MRAAQGYQYLELKAYLLFLTKLNFVTEGHLAVVARLLQSYCDVNARNEDGMNGRALA